MGLVQQRQWLVWSEKRAIKYEAQQLECVPVHLSSKQLQQYSLSAETSVPK